MSRLSVALGNRLRCGRDTVRCFARDDAGNTAVEYAVLASAIAIGIAGGVIAFGVVLKTGVYDRIASIFS